MKFDDRSLQDILDVVDSRIDRALNRQSRTEYGSVDSVSSDGNLAEVLLLGSSNPSGGFRVPAQFRVEAGDYVRVTIVPSGDRWVAANLTAERLRSGPTLILSVDGDSLEGTNSKSITVPQTYQHLRLVIAARSDAAQNFTGINLRINEDSGSNYGFQRLEVAGGTVTATRSTSQTNWLVGIATAANDGSSVSASATTVELPHYRETAWRRNYLARSIAQWNTGIRMEETAGIWNTNAIEQLRILLGTGNFTSRSRIDLYGLGYE